MPARSAAPAQHIKDVNVRYHDAAATEYDTKWGIDFGPIGKDQVRGKLDKALGSWPTEPFGDALEIGSGTGYFSLNLFQLGAIERLVATDISPGMLSTLTATARRLGLEVETAVTDAEGLPFDDAASIWSSATPSFTTSPIWTRRWRSSGGCFDRVARSCSAASRPATA